MSDGIKHDKGKLQWHLFPFDAAGEIVKILMYGAKKYEKHNWMKIKDTTRYFDAAIRHLQAHNGGEAKDPESGMSHLAHAGCNILFLIWFEMKGKLKL